ncbi:hypothetical protein QT381_12960 [Galbitalea sp. SE-J8]|uniref:hypothetical protein n=1 Tax=Galbitalea sp. SE-J8 TaxID=3054952 RepID=UPI00259CAFAB|nr:hypothetical protein [Galbitalea sp. SE-J8]MDM4763917.1 hypothetical protein [Galbitalea sp. SE-J8]
MTETHIDGELARQTAQPRRNVYGHQLLVEERNIDEHVLESLPSYPIPELAPLGRILTQWPPAFLAK